MTALSVSNTAPAIQNHSHPRALRLARVLGRMLLAGVNLYAVGLLLYLALRLLVGERLGIVSLGNSLAAPLLIPALILLPLCLLLRRWQQSALLFPPALAFVLLFGSFYTARAVSLPPNAPQFTILTYNLHADTRNMDSAIAVIRSANADIVAVQEFTSDAAARFDAELAGTYPYRSLHPEGPTVAGQGILSRFPLTSEDYWRRPDSLGSMRVQFVVNGTTVTLYNVHPPVPSMTSGFSTLRRGQEIDDLLQRAGQDSGAVLLVGDYNMSDQSDDYHHITETYHDTYHEVGWGLGLTYPHLYQFHPLFGLIPPLVRLDYVFHTDAIASVEAQTWPDNGGSDHYPLWVKLALVSH